MSNEDTSFLEIARGVGDGETRVERFAVPFTPGASVLDGLLWIREHADASLAFRFSCISANVCKECVMQVDGRNVYACMQRLKPGTTVIEPLKGKRRMRDLACDTVPPKEKPGRVSAA
ncbi:MAG: succinate dehydrogenase/fumarate reductase-like Fe-S protein [Gammaproteobacteria bacterium]|jgi:succinate dehydrogenase/fumarate reductase-like Fe-S protein